jgi:hypothetical protein
MEVGMDREKFWDKMDMVMGKDTRVRWDDWLACLFNGCKLQHGLWLDSGPNVSIAFVLSFVSVLARIYNVISTSIFVHCHAFCTSLFTSFLFIDAHFFLLI